MQLTKMASRGPSRLAPLVRCLGLLGYLSLALPVLAAEPPCALTDPQVIAELDGVALPLKAVTLLESMPRQGNQPVTRELLVASLVDNRIIAREALQTLGKERLLRAPEVAFNKSYLVQQRIAGVYRTLFEKQMDADIQRRFGGSLSTLVSDRFQEQQAQIHAILTPKQALRDDIDAEQQQQAQQLIVARYQFPQQPAQDISLWDLYGNQNVQGRMRLQQGDLGMLAKILDDYVAAAFVEDWVAADSGLTPNERQWIEGYVVDGTYKLAYLEEQGLALGFHAENNKLREVQQQLSAAEIRAYYDANKEQFRRVEAVQARHIRTADEASANAAYQALQGGMSFADAVRKYSIDADKNKPVPGDLGLVDLTQRKGWLEAAMFALQPGKPSRPIRSPGASNAEVAWEIFQIDDQRHGYYAPDSETVRYLAGRALATRKLIEHYQQQRARLYDAANICINTSLLHASKAKLMNMSARQSVSGGV